MDDLHGVATKYRDGDPSAQPWHAASIDGVLSALGTSRHGLTADEAGARLRAHGPNALPEPPRPSRILRFLAQFNSTLIYFLLAAAVAAWFLGHRVDAGVIVAVVLVNAVVGFLQEDKAERALSPPSAS
jgi:magnesium-transporting ATPase (P-type)